VVARTATDGGGDEDHHKQTARSRPLYVQALGLGDIYAFHDHADLIGDFVVFGYAWLQVHVRGLDLLTGQGFHNLAIEFFHMDPA
jgi:hypothetical protein